MQMSHELPSFRAKCPVNRRLAGTDSDADVADKGRLVAVSCPIFALTRRKWGILYPWGEMGRKKV